MKTLRQLPFELIFWIAALVLLAMDEPVGHDHVNHFSLCPLANMGISWCPGCGIGRSITQIFHGNIRESLELHWFGIPALMIIGHRIIALADQFIDKKRNLKYKEERYV